MTLRIQFLIACFLMSIVTITAQDQETRNLDGFEKVSVSSGISATLVKGTTNEIDITTKNIDLDQIETDVINGALKVNIDEQWLKMIFDRKSRNRKVEVVITYTEEISAVKSGGGATVETEGALVTNRISLTASGGATMIAEIEAKDAKVTVSGGGSMKTSGETNYLQVKASGGGSYNGKRLVAQEVEAKASGGGSANVVAEESIKAKASSGGSITYKGSPSNKDISKSSGGSVSKA